MRKKTVLKVSTSSRKNTKFISRERKSETLWFLWNATVILENVTSVFCISTCLQISIWTTKNFSGNAKRPELALRVPNCCRLAWFCAFLPLLLENHHMSEGDNQILLHGEQPGEHRLFSQHPSSRWRPPSPEVLHNHVPCARTLYFTILTLGSSRGRGLGPRSAKPRAGDPPRPVGLGFPQREARIWEQEGSHSVLR